MKSLRSNDLKESNRISVLESIRRGVCSRAEISSALGMSRPAVSALVDELITEGLVVETGHGQSTVVGGKKPVLLDLNVRAGLIIAVYFNEKWYEIAITDLSGTIISYTKKCSRIYKDYTQTFDLIICDIKELIYQARVNHFCQSILACGISLRGVVNPQLGMLEYSASVPEWSEIPVGEYFGNALHVPIFIENNARALTYAELLSGVKSQTLVCVSIGLGIGTGVVIQNEVYRGANSGAVTFAHTTIMENGPVCHCGNRGCWEALASVTAFLNELGRKKEEYYMVDLNQALQKFQEGDPVVRDVMLNYTGYWIGVGIANLLNVFNPDQVIIQGELTEASEELRNKIEQVAMSRALPVARKVNISFSQLRDRAQVKGSAAVVIKHFFSKDHHREIWTKQGTNS